MFKTIKFIIIIIIIPYTIYGQKQDSISIKKILNEVNVNALRAGEKTPVAFTNIEKEEIEKINLGQDLPYLISLTPSVVTSSDAGAGIGYTGLRIRGTDPTRINVTVNGIPLNDSESQGVWWVNMPDFSSSVENIQIQRGVGTSTNGASAFGASINLKTDNSTKNPYLTTHNSIGSFNSFKNNIEFGTGLINDKVAFDGRISKISSDGYIDRANSNLRSIYLQSSYFTNNSILKALVFSGHERTYQAWYGVPIKYLDTNRTFNPYTYENEVDDYTQTHYQLHYSKQISAETNLNTGFHYTHGEGYYEQYRTQENFDDYGLANVIIGNDTLTQTDLIRRKWLNNDFGGVIYSLNHKMNNTDLIFGGASNRYSGQHYGNIIWAQHASNSTINHQYYWNKAEKLDNNFYVKANYKHSNATSIYFDIQKRNINYSFEGYDEAGNPSQQEVSHNFFNPKAGIFHEINDNQSVYISFSIANKEPNRDDYVENKANEYPSHETLNDTEFGYTLKRKKLFLKLNFYHMQYKNQLVLTGEINDVGAYRRANIDDSYRRGIEFESTYNLADKITWAANMTISESQIVSHSEFIDNWDSGVQEKIEYTNTNLAFSPEIIWASNLSYKINNNLSLYIVNKYVGEQFIDNTSSQDRKIDDYLVNNLRISYNLKSKFFQNAQITLLVNNLLNNEYVSNAWVYRFISDYYDPTGDDHYVYRDSEKGYNMAAYFPQATRNYLLGLKLAF